MKPPLFAYEAPSTVADVLALLDRYQDGGKVLAGGQSLVPLLNMRLARPDRLIDINRVVGLAGVTVEADAVTIGAMARQRRVERSPEVRAHLPLLVEALGHVGHSQIRNRGTIGGTLCHADPAAELPAVAVAVDATLQVEKAGVARTVAAADFFVSHLTTTLAPDELLTRVRLPTPRPGQGWSIGEFARRSGDFALVGVVGMVGLGNGAVDDARIVVFGVGERPVRVGAAEEILVGSDGGSEAIGEAAATVARELSPGSDMHASAAARRRMASTLTARVLHEARARAGGERP